MKVTCAIPHVTENINGIPFERQEDGSVVAVGLSKDDAEQFADIPGYTVEEEVDEEQKPMTRAEAKAAAKAAKDAEEAEAAAKSAAEADAEKAPAA